MRFPVIACLYMLAIAICQCAGCVDRAEQIASEASTLETDKSDGDPYKFQTWRRVEDFANEIAQFETVFWEPTDTTSLRKLIRETSLAQDKRILEIGTGTGLVSLCCLVRGARSVVATDVNPSAVWNARYNADVLEVADRLEVREVPTGRREAFSVINASEKFDLIISNPPWEDKHPDSIDQYALYDEGFLLLRSLLSNADKHLNPEGRLLLAYGCVSAIHEVKRLAPAHGFEVVVLDDRDLSELPEDFLPGMLLELRKSADSLGAAER